MKYTTTITFSRFILLAAISILVIVDLLRKGSYEVEINNLFYFTFFLVILITVFNWSYVYLLAKKRTSILSKTDVLYLILNIYLVLIGVHQIYESKKIDDINKFGLFASALGAYTVYVYAKAYLKSKNKTIV